MTSEKVIINYRLQLIINEKLIIIHRLQLIINEKVVIGPLLTSRAAKTNL
jgi:hypothetical protein